MFQSSRLRTLFPPECVRSAPLFSSRSTRKFRFSGPTEALLSGGRSFCSELRIVILYTFSPFLGKPRRSGTWVQNQFPARTTLLFRLPTKNSLRTRISEGCFSLLFLYRRSCSSGREKCRRLKATYTPSWSLEEVTKSAAACTPGTALPMATPRPARRSMPASTSPSPQATA